MYIEYISFIFSPQVIFHIFIRERTPISLSARTPDTVYVSGMRQVYTEPLIPMSSRIRKREDWGKEKERDKERGKERERYDKQ